MSSTAQEKPSLRVLQRKSSNIARQAAANRSTSAYAAPAVGSKVISNPALTTAPPYSMSAVTSGTACNVHDCLDTQPTSDATATVPSLEDEHAALTVSIPGQVDAQEHRSVSHLHLPTAIASVSLASVFRHAADTAP